MTQRSSLDATAPLILGGNDVTGEPILMIDSRLKTHQFFAFKAHHINDHIRCGMSRTDF